jgi:hypothetical protein
MKRNFVHQCIIILHFSVALSGCKRSRLSECQQLLDEVATASGNAMKLSGQPEPLREALEQAATRASLIALQSEDLKALRDAYVSGIHNASQQKDTELERAATGALGFSTAEAVAAINLRCSGER